MQIDLRTLVVTIHPNPEKEKLDMLAKLTPDGPENWAND